MADGATIQESSYKALQNGVNTQTCLDIARKLRQKTAAPLVFMTYYNPVFSYGEVKFCRDCASAGIDGLIIPDLPPEEGELLERTTKEQGLDLIYLLAPTSTAERIQIVAAKSRGYIYLVSITGVTGARRDISTHLETFVNRVRQTTQLPLCVGFGISTSAQARQISRLAEGVIIGSKLIQLMKTDPSLVSLQEFISEVRESLGK
jgi:tryptophan synthase alpha chain